MTKFYNKDVNDGSTPEKANTLKNIEEIQNKGPINITGQQLHFGPFVMWSKLKTGDISELIKRGKKAKKSANSRLAGQLKKQFLFEKDDENWFWKDIFQPYFQAYRQLHCQYHGTPNLPVAYKSLELWINYMKAGEFNPPHTHTGDLTFVIFLETPKDIEKEIKNFEGTGPRPGQLLFEYGEQSTRPWNKHGNLITPSAGDFLIFPTLLKHWVCPFKSKGTRVSVSGNILYAYANEIEYPKDYL